MYCQNVSHALGRFAVGGLAGATIAALICVLVMPASDETATHELLWKALAVSLIAGILAGTAAATVRAHLSRYWLWLAIVLGGSLLLPVIPHKGPRLVPLGAIYVAEHIPWWISVIHAVSSIGVAVALVLLMRRRRQADTTTRTWLLCHYVVAATVAVALCLVMLWVDVAAHIVVIAMLVILGRIIVELATGKR